ncbi:ferredoxin [Nocardia blacklockiae]|uniref:ferredoxin n=1 Tax=Nocardia blacklockiae TaxID=480036 RepID=UPI0018950DDC|nr:ferredoxin [Nocardia blacklockiae]MBF6170012.1 ferredoxin [Nocardia blacklockiae]
MRIRLDRTLCDGFGLCARHAPRHFSLDDWGYATAEGDRTVAPADRDSVMRALLDCPVHAITVLSDHENGTAATAPTETAPAAEPGR